MSGDHDAQPRFTLKQELFIAAYLGEAKGNATEAARIAGYKKPKEQGYENLNKPHIHARVKDYVASKFATADEVLTELTDVAMAKWRDFLIIKRDKDGNEVEVKMDLHAKVKSLELLGKHHQLFTENMNVSGSLTREYIIVEDDA